MRGSRDGACQAGTCTLYARLRGCIYAHWDVRVKVRLLAWNYEDWDENGDEDKGTNGFEFDDADSCSLDGCAPFSYGFKGTGIGIGIGIATRDKWVHVACSRASDYPDFTSKCYIITTSRSVV